MANKLVEADVSGIGEEGRGLIGAGVVSLEMLYGEAAHVEDPGDDGNLAVVVDYSGLFEGGVEEGGVFVDWGNLMTQMDYLTAMQLCLCVDHSGLDVSFETTGAGAEGVMNAMAVVGGFEVGGVCHSCEVGRIGWDGKCSSCGHNESAHGQ